MKQETCRPPIVAIMGHVDHGKSTLLDYIRKTNVVEHEAGGITQHVSAYEVTHPSESGEEKRITFLDTPGHEAFTHMRARGATVADIAILVVSAEDGVKKQTLEALNAIQDAGIPYIVAINKIDKPGANIERTKNNLLENGIYLEGMGGDVPFVAISAKTGQNVDELLDMILLVAELQELRTDLNAPPEGFVIESHVDSKKGISATLIVTRGTLKRGMFVVAGAAVAPVRIFENFLGESIDHAEPSAPVRIVGWSTLPPVGDVFASFSSKKEAERFAHEMSATQRETTRNGTPSPSTNTSEEDETVYNIPLIIKADVSGTLEAALEAVRGVAVERVSFRVVSSGVGPVNESDVKMLIASAHRRPIILAFGTDVDPQAATMAEQYGIEIQTFTVIYKMTEWLHEAAQARRPRITTEETSGVANVIRVFSSQKHTHVIGGKVTEGALRVGDRVHVLRRNEKITDGKILELRRQKLTADVIPTGDEFGAKVEAKLEIAEGDVLKAIRLVEK